MYTLTGTHTHTRVFIIVIDVMVCVPMYTGVAITAGGRRFRRLTYNPIGDSIIYYSESHACI